ncbi:Tm-1-like ATP-binding domain-containing protein [Ruminiclostridium cellobioparum]|uniref:Tm-1-like ATP-binding domain-containing protein n=1 Tax=Ruminiclostridium cellobioparum TaxID=29355 RepID=UPI0004870B67|nr:Tm-1-like ATP-binding domain-containing protein [Ruminiclostridium cellobioparum]
MEKTIAIIASLDTKEAEVTFVKEMIEKQGCKTFIIDVGAKGSERIMPHIRAEDVARVAGREWDSIYDIPKHEMIAGLLEGIAALMPELYAQGNFDAVLSLGGAQNTTIGISAMKSLPVGLPKLMVSTIACGQRTFESFVDTKDITIMPSIADISGINNLTRTILSNAAAAIAGMAKHAGAPLKSGQELIVGATLMGVTNTGVAEAVKLMEKAGFQVISFHSTGVGGRAMEEFIQEGAIRAVMDLSLHEITSEMFGKGFSTGANNRLAAACNAGIPQVVAPGGVDFIDFYAKELPQDLNKRKHIYHNSNIVHVKLLEQEIVRVGEIITERLNKSRGPVTVIIPLRGLRQNTSPGEALYAPEVDNALIEVLYRGLRRDIKIVDVDANINDEIFSKTAAAELLRLLRQQNME